MTQKRWIVRYEKVSLLSLDSTFFKDVGYSVNSCSTFSLFQDFHGFGCPLSSLISWIESFFQTCLIMVFQNLPKQQDRLPATNLLCLTIRYFIPMKKENSTCEIASAALGTLFLCCVRVWTKIQERCCSLFLFSLRNVTCARHATYNTNTTWEERSERNMGRSANPLK